MIEDPNEQTASFDLNQIAAAFPEQAATMLLDRYLVDRAEASARVFRVYQPTPAHYHRWSDEYLYVLSGRGTFWMEKPERASEFEPGTFLFFRKRTVHAMPSIQPGPVVFLALDVPRREPTDIIFVQPDESTPGAFIREHRP